MEYWIDYSLDGKFPMEGMRMPDRYVVEMFIDRLSASKTYLKDKYKSGAALSYYEKGKHKYIIHPESQALLEKLLKMEAEKGEEETFRYIRREILYKNH